MFSGDLPFGLWCCQHSDVLVTVGFLLLHTGSIKSKEAVIHTDRKQLLFYHCACSATYSH